MLARCLLPEIQKFFESEEGKKEFEEWKQKQELKWYWNIDKRRYREVWYRRFSLLGIIKPKQKSEPLT